MKFDGPDQQPPASAAEPASDALAQERRTRDRLRQTVITRGPITAAELAEEFGLTASGVRRHLDALESEGLIASRESTATRRGRGRPARCYVGTNPGQQSLGGSYDSLANEALNFLGEVAGPDAIRQFADARASRLEEQVAEFLHDAPADPLKRAEFLAQQLSESGYAASIRPITLPLIDISSGTATNDAAKADSNNAASEASSAPGADATESHSSAPHVIGVQLCQGHCPVQNVAARHPEFCEAETEVFSRLLGVHVQRLATLANGEHVCTTYVPATPANSENPSERTAS